MDCTMSVTLEWKAITSNGLALTSPRTSFPTQQVTCRIAESVWTKGARNSCETPRYSTAG
jgi:hypothetical protein